MVWFWLRLPSLKYINITTSVFARVSGFHEYNTFRCCWEVNGRRFAREVVAQYQQMASMWVYIQTLLDGHI